jgi:FkbM family methyltransferase
VYAFEPQPTQVEYLRRAFAAMRYDNVAIVPRAISDRCGEMALHLAAGTGHTHQASLENRAVGGESTVGSLSQVAVEVTTLDAFFDEHERVPSFLKIDVEGHELAVLTGARRLLEQHRPTILVECEARHRADGDVRPVFELLQSLGYEGSFFHGRSRRPLGEFDAVVHQRLDPANPDRVPRGYVNNFAFVAR